MPSAMALGKFHGEITAPTPSGMYFRKPRLAGQLHDGLGRVQHQRLARIEFQEVDGFGGVGFGFVVVLADFEHQPGVELELALADDVGGAEENAGALFDRGELPLLESGERGLHGGLHVLGAGLLMDADDLAGVRRIHGDDLLARSGCAGRR